jgi:hypothetical protein
MSRVDGAHSATAAKLYNSSNRDRGAQAGFEPENKELFSLAQRKPSVFNEEKNGSASWTHFELRRTICK